MAEDNEEVIQTETEEVPTTAIQKHSSPDYLLELAITKDVDIEKLERLMAMKERYDKEEARKAYFEALAGFQSECPPIKKNRQAKFSSKDGNQTIGYNWADLAEISSQIKPYALKWGFSYRWEFAETDDKYECVCIITHIQGHSEKSSMTAGREDSGTKNIIQAIGSARTYLQRYTLTAGFGITTAEDDTDAVTQNIIDEYEELTKDWQFKEAYIQGVVETIRSKSAFRKFINSLPDEMQTNKFIALLTKAKPELHRRLWIGFQQQTNQTANNYITELSSKLIKE